MEDKSNIDATNVDHLDAAGEALDLWENRLEKLVGQDPSPIELLLSSIAHSLYAIADKVVMETIGVDATVEFVADAIPVYRVAD